MSTSDIINIVLAVLTVIVGGVGLYFKSNARLNSTVSGLIAAAESETSGLVNGGQQFQWVVGQLYRLIPTPIRPFIPEAVIATLVQNAFNQIKMYAKAKADQATAKLLAAAPTGPAVGTVSDTTAATPASTGTAQANQTKQVTSELNK